MDRLDAMRVILAVVDGGSLSAGIRAAFRPLPGIDQETARAIVDMPHQTCAYSKATRGNIDVEINLV